MTDNADFKKHVRERMAATGENYTTAQAALQQDAQARLRSEYAMHEKAIRSFFDGERLRSIPTRRRARVSVLLHLLTRFEVGRSYTEREVSDLLGQAHEDFAFLRRELVEYGYLHRAEGRYWVTGQAPRRSPNVAQEVPSFEADLLAALPRWADAAAPGTVPPARPPRVRRMGTATYRDLCIDAVDAEASARFWAGALGLEVRENRGDTIWLEGPRREQRVWVNRVPEPHEAKNRIHIDVNTESLERLLSLGAKVVDDASHPWTIMADPDGGELCAFVREGGIERRLYELVVDCRDPRSQAHWWQGVLGGSVGTEPDEDWWWLESVAGTPFECIVFVPVPEPKTVKNRVHWDVEADLDAVLGLGASLLTRHEDHAVVADPEGNEFCVFPVAELNAPRA